MPETDVDELEVMSFDQASEHLYYWSDQRVEDRDRAFDTLIGWVAGKAITGDPNAAETLRLIRDRAERS